jgi:hypothetical protein
LDFTLLVFQMSKISAVLARAGFALRASTALVFDERWDLPDFIEL